MKRDQRKKNKALKPHHQQMQNDYLGKKLERKRRLRKKRKARIPVDYFDDYFDIREAKNVNISDLLSDDWDDEIGRK